MAAIETFIKEQFTRYRQLLLYGVIGGFCAFVDFCIYTILCKLGVPYLIANLIGVHCGIICSFLLNRHYNFKVKDKAKLRFLSFYIIGLIGLAISSGMLYLLISYYHFGEIYAKIPTIVVVALLQFALNKFITFRK
jgi:putative flippase GtrA